MSFIVSLIADPACGEILQKGQAQLNAYFASGPYGFTAFSVEPPALLQGGQTQKNLPLLVSYRLAHGADSQADSQAGNQADNKAGDKNTAEQQRHFLKEKITALLNGLPLDFGLYSEAFLKSCPRLFLADMDSTMITVECIDELADYKGLKDEIAKITEAAMAGHLVFEEALIQRVALLKGLPERDLQACYDSRVHITNGADDLLKALKKRGLHTVLVSGGFTYFSARIAQRLGFDRHVANQLDMKDGFLTGRLLAPLSGPMTKNNILNEERSRLGLTQAQTLAIGDGANDIPMIRGAGLGIAYRAKDALKQEAGLLLDHTGLAGLRAFFDHHFPFPA